MKLLNRLRRHLPVVALLVFGSLVSILFFVCIRSLEKEKAKVAFQRAAQERFDDLQSELDLAIGKVVALGAFCNASHPLSQSSFNNFAAPLLQGRDSGIQALEWVPRVSLGQRAAFERAARANGLRGFEIRDRLGPGKMVRASTRPDYFPILYVQPYLGNELALGYDPYSTRDRREAMMHAATTGGLTATQRITLVQETSDQYGILIFRPVFSQNDSHAGVRQLLGYALGVLRLGDVVEQHGAKSGVDLTLTDLSATPHEQQLYPCSKKRPRQASTFTQYRAIRVGGRDWQLAASPDPGAFPVSNTYSYLVGALSLLITLLVAGYSEGALDRRLQVERLVDERTDALNSALNSLAEAHRGLGESGAKYRRLVEDSPSAIVVEREGRIVLVNRAAVEMFSFDATRDASPHSLAEFVAPERRENALELLRYLYERESQVSPRDTRLLRRDGSIFDAEVVASSFFHGGVRSVQVVLRDITQRKRDQSENARLILAIEQVEESIVVTDREGNIVYVNPAFERISGYSREEALGRNPRILKSGRQPSEFYAALWKLLNAGESWNGRFVNRAKNGRLYTEEATISPVANRDGEITNYVAVKRDVTVETELQERLHQSQKMDAIGRLAGGVAHDFNNMLMVIVSYADLIESSLPDDNPLRQHTKQILHAAQRSAALTRQLLVLSRKQVFTPQIVNCNVILSETVSMIRRIISENIDLKCNLAPELWNVKADADQIVQVILNLCVNARDAMPNGGALLLATRNYPVDSGFVEITVSDSGVGIPTEIQEKLFEPFFTTKERGKGTGLGLATVYGIVQQSGGSISVDSLPGRGATFTIHLPRCMEFATLSASPVQKPALIGASLILVVEDEDALREALAAHLRDHGYRVLVAANGIAALDILDENSDVSILISDLIMPRMGGHEMARLAAKKTPGLRFIFMSGYDDQASDDEGVEGPQIHLQKPFTMEVLLSRIAELNGPDRQAILFQP